MSHTPTNSVSRPKERQGSFLRVSSPDSVRSESLDMEQEVLKLLHHHSNSGVVDGAKVLFLEREDVEKLSSKLFALMQDGKKHSVGNAQLASLNTELATLRLSKSMAESDLSKKDEAIKRLTFDLELLRKQSEDQRTLLADARLEHQATRNELVSVLNKNKTRISELNKEIAKNDKATSPALIDSQSKLREELVSSNKEINNKLTIKNAELEQLKLRSSALEGQLLALSNELNAAKASLSLARQGKSFAQVATEAGLENVQFVKTKLYKLPKAAKEWLQKAKDATEIKDKAYFLTVAVDKSHVPAAKWYAPWMHSLLFDLKYVSYASRKKFLGPIQTMLESFENPSKILSEEQLSAIVTDIPVEKVFLAKKFQRDGVKTLKDVITKGIKIETLDPDHFEDSKEVSTSKTLASAKERVAEAEGLLNDDPIADDYTPKTWLGRITVFLVGGPDGSGKPSIWARLKRSIWTSGIKKWFSYFKHD